MNYFKCQHLATYVLIEGGAKDVWQDVNIDHDPDGDDSVRQLLDDGFHEWHRMATKQEIKIGKAIGGGRKAKWPKQAAADAAALIEKK